MIRFIGLKPPEEVAYLKTFPNYPPLQELAIPGFTYFMDCLIWCDIVEDVASRDVDIKDVILGMIRMGQMVVWDVTGTQYSSDANVIKPKIKTYRAEEPFDVEDDSYIRQVLDAATIEKIVATPRAVVYNLDLGNWRNGIPVFNVQLQVVRPQPPEEIRDMTNGHVPPHLIAEEGGIEEPKK